MIVLKGEPMKLEYQAHWGLVRTTLKRTKLAEAISVETRRLAQQVADLPELPNNKLSIEEWAHKLTESMFSITK